MTRMRTRAPVPDRGIVYVSMEEIIVVRRIAGAGDVARPAGKGEH